MCINFKNDTQIELYSRINDYALDRDIMGKKDNKKDDKLVFDAQERVNFVTGFSKRKQEKKELLKQKAMAREREIRLLLRQKKREALKRGQECAKRPDDIEQPQDR